MDVDAIELTENRELFRKHMIEIGVEVAPSQIANSFLKAKKLLNTLDILWSYDLLFTLGGSGGSFVMKPDQFDEALAIRLDASPTHEVLVEKQFWDGKNLNWNCCGIKMTMCNYLHC